jgi:hypothetical protein
MRSTEPPRLAIWLLRHFGCGLHTESLLGDLAEQYRQGHSRLWYWKQVVASVLLSFVSEVWNHRLLALRALTVGWVIKAICGFAFLYIYGTPAKRLFTGEIESSLLVAVIGLLAMMFNAWIVAQTHRSHYKAMVLLYLAVELIGIPFTFVTRGIFGAWYWIFLLSQLMNAIVAHFGIFNSIASLCVAATVVVIGTLIGGGFFSRPRSNSSEERNLQRSSCSVVQSLRVRSS